MGLGGIEIAVAVEFRRGERPVGVAVGLGRSRPPAGR